VRTPQTKGITRHFDPGIVALALVSAIVLAATIVLIATTALQIAWSDSCFQWLAATMAAACAGTGNTESLPAFPSRANSRDSYADT
jgi:hypothetical protein